MTANLYPTVTLSRDSGPGVYTVRTCAGVALGRVTATADGYVAETFRNPRIFEGEPVGVFPRRREAVNAVAAAKGMSRGGVGALQ